MLRFYSTLVLCFLGSFSVNAQHECAIGKTAHPTTTLQKANATPVQMAIMEKYDVRFHHLKLSVERQNKTIAGSVRTIAVTKVAGVDSFMFQLHADLILDSVTAAGVRHNFTRYPDVATVALGSSLPAGATIDLIIYYHGTPPTGGSAAIGDGFSNKASPTYGNQITWSLSQPYSAYEWWPCKQSLQDKIDSVFLDITTDTSNKVGSNGVLKAVVPAGTGKHTYKWETRYPMNFYLVAVCVGQYVEYNDYAHPKQIADSVRIQHYIYNTSAYANNMSAIKATAPQLELFSDLFGLYPFYREKYGHVMAPFSGGMEHQTMTTLGILNFGIVAHELAHQWFGDNVTCATWKDIWLNEGSATYCEYLAAQYLTPASNALSVLRKIQSEAKKNSGTVYVDDTTNVNRIFSSSLTYNKGGAVLHMLRYHMGDSAFFRLCKTYQQRFGNSNATTAQYQALVQEITGQDYAWFFSQWIYGNGFPWLNLRWNYTSNMLTMVMRQDNPFDASNIFKLKVQVKVYAGGKDTLVDILFPQNGNLSESWQAFAWLARPDSVIIDPQEWLLKIVTVTEDTSLSSLQEISRDGATEMMVYPNPATQSIHVTGYTNALEYELSDMSGRIIATGRLDANGEISVAEIPQGIYVLTGVSNNRELLRQKLIIMH